MLLALSWLTVLPVKVGEVDTRAARRAIALTPVVGVLLGVLAAGVLWLLWPTLLTGFLVVGLLALLTRGMHLDGLADTADGLGCYGPPERALAVMKDGGAGPFAVVTLIVVLGAQAAAMTSVPLAAVVLAMVAGRAAFPLCCLRGVPAARPEGLGALVAGTQSPWVAGAWWLALLGASAYLGLRGPIAIVLAFLVVMLLINHVKRRFGGITGDVLGAASELATLAVLVVLA